MSQIDVSSYVVVENAEQAEALVDTLQMDGATLTDANLSGLSSSDLAEHLADLEAELHCINSADMEGEVKQMLEEDIVETVIGEQEVEIEAEEVERTGSPEEILPDYKEPKTIKYETTETAAPPPLRPLTIAPKPTNPKLPLALKTALVNAGSPQIVLIQSTGNSSNTMNLAGQQVKLVSAQVPGYQSASSKSNIVQLRTLSKSQGTEQLKVTKKTTAQNKNYVAKVIVSGQQQQPTAAKTITLAQAQQMGLIAAGKSLKVLPQSKSPAKILPAPAGSKGGAQRVIIRQSGGQLKGNTVGFNQVIRIPAGQTLGAGQLHQIAVPGKGMQYIRFVGTQSNTVTKSTSNVIKVLPLSSQSQTRPVAPKPINTAPVTSATGQRLLVPAAAAQKLQSNQIVMVPAQYIPTKTRTHQSPEREDVQQPPPPPPPQQSQSSQQQQQQDTFPRGISPNGIRPRKPCNCTKSQCLKLYCDCFANGEFCHQCNCMNCSNNLEREEERQRAIRNCLERNPNAFRPKIGKGREAGDYSVRKHTKGCNCKRSGCLKNYCECYEAKIACSSNCKCVGCRNIEDAMEKKSLRNQSTGSGTVPPDTHALLQVATRTKHVLPSSRDLFSFRPPVSAASPKLPSALMTAEVTEATNQCMIAQAEQAQRNMLSEEESHRQILEEFGRCLIQIIECSKKTPQLST